MNHRLAIPIAIVGLLLFAPTVHASSGALRKASIKQCPNGIYYGQHGGDNHWHQAEASNTSSGWSAVGEAFYYDPCPPNEIVYAPVKEESTPAPAPIPTSEPESESVSEPDDGYAVGFTAEPLHAAQSNSNNNEPATNAAAQVDSNTDSESDSQNEHEDNEVDKEVASADDKDGCDYERDDDDWDSWPSNNYSSNENKAHGKGSAVAVGLVGGAAVAGGIYAVKKNKK